MDTVKIAKKNVEMVAHRGLSGIEKENTCAAFLAAANRSYFGIETDVHVTKDGEFVVIHDETLERISLGESVVNVEESDYNDFKDIVLPDTDGSRIRQDIRIPLLSEYISICKKYDKICVLELKKHFEEKDLERLVEQIREMEYIDGVIFISFDFKNCVNARKLLPENAVQWLTKDEEITEEIIEKLSENKLDIDIYYKRLNAENIALLHENGIKVNCWTCDDKESAENLADWGVDFITSNILE